MKIILLQDVKKHGKKGEIIDVADGFGKNYLIKNKLGVLADTAGLKKLNTEKKKEKEIDDQSRKEAQNTKEKLEKLNLIFKVKTGKEDKVFGSISAKQIVEQLKNKGYNIAKKQIKTNNTISTLGFHNVDIELHKKVIATIKIELKK